MRKNAKNNHLSVRAISGTEVVLFGLNIPQDRVSGLLGFKIEKKLNGQWILLNDGRTFPESTESLVQQFMWSDYQVDANKSYDYRFSAIYGEVANMQQSPLLTLNIKTENPEEAEHAIFFNRGVAGSQAFTRKFSKYQKWYKDEPSEQDPNKIRYTRFLKPEDIPKREAYKWLSRGLEEALLGFIDQAKNSSYSIRASLYELSYKPAAQAFVDAMERGVDVKIIHHAKQKSVYNRYSNKLAVTTVEQSGKETMVYKKSEIRKEKRPDSISLKAMNIMGSIGISSSKYLDIFKTVFVPRSNANISHNKFILLLKDGKPIQVWTGSTNLTGGGLFGQSNVGHIIRNTEIAEDYHKYWIKLSGNPRKTTTKKAGQGMKDWLQQNNPNLIGNIPTNSVRAIFSPRKDLGMLNWYAERMKEAKNSVFLTLAFSIDDSFFNVVKDKSNHATDESNFLRYLLLESKNAQYIKPKYPDMVKCKQNEVAYGDKLRSRKGFRETEELIESLTGLNTNVNYLHTKYMLIDALTDDPLVISGSANFSEASTLDNDENMLVIRGNTRIADIYLTEFMRLFNHFHRRNIENGLNNSEYAKSQLLIDNDSWMKPYFDENTKKFKERILFSVEGQ